MTLLADRTVQADLMEYPDGSNVKILGWISLRPGQGNTKAALVELRGRFSEVTAFNVFPQAMSYWRRMRSLRLVDAIFDDEGIRIS